MTDRSHRSLADVRAELGLTPGSGHGQGHAPTGQQHQPGPPTVDAPLGDAAGEIDALFALVQDHGYHIAPGGYGVQFDEAGRPRVTLAVYPPTAIGATAAGDDTTDDADTTDDGGGGDQ